MAAPAVVGAGLAGFKFGNTVGGWIGTWSCSDVTREDERNQSSLVSSANDVSSSGNTSSSSTATAETSSGGRSAQTGSSDSSATDDAQDDESAVCKPDDDKGKPNPVDYASSRFDTVAVAGPGLRSVVVRADTVLQMTSLPRLANDGVRLAEPGLFAALPGVQKVDTVVGIEGIRDVLAELTGRR